MEAIAVRKNLHQLIDKIEDIEYLNDLYDSIKLFDNHKKDILDDLSPIQLERLDKSITQMNHGEVIPANIVKAKYQKWLTK
jgi:hypothetical protein